MRPPHSGQMRLMIDEIMLALGSPGMVSIVIIPLLLRDPWSSSESLDNDANLLIGGASGMPNAGSKREVSTRGASISRESLLPLPLGNNLALPGVRLAAPRPTLYRAKCDRLARC